MALTKRLSWFYISLIMISLAFSLGLKASEETLLKAQSAMSNKQYEEAKNLFLELSTTKKYQNEGLVGLAETALNMKQLDEAEGYIEKVLQVSLKNPEHFFIAGRIAGAQAQEANIFSKLSYARDSKNYFEKALVINPSHKASIIGLIRFHEQAPVMAGGEKESIVELINLLREVDAKEAFSMENGKLIDKGEFELLGRRYQRALSQKDSSNQEQFKYDYAMQLSNYGHYSKALDVLLSIDLTQPKVLNDFAAMRFYQVAKLAAESRRELDLGLQSIKQYSALTNEQKTIPEDWVQFRLMQLQFLKNEESVTSGAFKNLKVKTQEEALKTKINAFLKEIRSN